MKRAPVQSKIACLQRAVKPLMSYRCSIWPPQRQIATEIDATQKRMIAIACPISLRPGEGLEQFRRRRGRHASQLACESGFWSQFWFGRALAWDDHVQRNRSVCKWNHSLRAFHDSAWLQEQRAAYAAVNPCRSNPWTLVAGRTGTRALPGKVHPRWQEAIGKVRNGTL